jgi:hypothetical protein
MNTTVYVISSVIWLALAIWVAVDANSHPDWAWQRAGQNKLVWIIVPIVGALLCGLVTLVMAIVYFASIKPKLAGAGSGGPL